LENALRNVAIIAHVDHGKTTLVDALFRESGLLGSRQDQAERVLDRNDLERERGITIFSKNASLTWKGVRINLIDTPGHADFGGQVERVLTMADGALILVDAFEGPRAQTRFVLEKALQNRLSILVVVNKMDRRDARPREVLDEMFDLLVDLGADDLAIDFPVLYASAREGWAALEPDPGASGMAPLLDRILEEVPAPAGGDGPLLFQVSTLDWDAYTGKMGIGRVQRGRLQRGMEVTLVRAEGPPVAGRIKEIYRFDGMERVPAESVGPGDIAVVAGMEELGLGDTLCHPDHLQALSPIRVEKPTIEMEVRINESPFAGRDGEHVTARKVQERLRRAGLSDPALKVEFGTGGWKIAGRGVLHLGILLETMRREGYELAVGRPKVLFQEIDGKKHEPLERARVEVPEAQSGRVIEYFGQRGARISDMVRAGNRTVLKMTIPTRGLLGARTQILRLTRGEGVVESLPCGFTPYQGPLPTRRNGVLIASDQGKATAYALRSLEDRGYFFVSPGKEVYAGMIVGENNKESDLVLNVVRGRKLSNMRSSTKDVDEKIRAARPLSLEGCLEYLEEDELLEITPVSLRLRKRILGQKDRKKAEPVG